MAGVAGAPQGVAFALLGPTASGKSRLAMQLAEKLPVEIVSLDSAQVYRGMDIGTAKPGAEERRRVPHHLIDVVDPDQPYSAGRWRQDAVASVLNILSKNKTPLIVGGTMLYYRGLAAGLDALPAADPGMRQAIDADAARRGWPALHAELAEVDPQSGQRIMPNDGQRIQRALEVWRLTGRPLSALHGAAKPELPFELKGFALIPSDREGLNKRIASRFDAMLHEGLVEELAALKKRFNLSAEMASMRAVGYRQAWDYLDNLIGKAELRGQAVAATRQLAKRQLTWLRSREKPFAELVRLDAGGGEDAPVALELLLHQLAEPLGRAGR